MTLADSVQVAFEALLANKLRACLTMLGIIIGVGSVIALMAVGQGSQKAITDKVQGLGSNLLFVRRGQQKQGGVGGGAGSAQTLSNEDVTGLQAIPGVAGVAPQVNAGYQLNAKGKNTFARAVAVTADYATVLNLTLSDGSFLSDDDVKGSARVIVLGSAVAEQIFPNGDAVGQDLRAGERNLLIGMKVIGVLSPKGGNTSQSQDNQVFIPITTQQHQFESRQGARNAQLVDQITIQAESKGQVAAVKAAATDLLLQNHRVTEADFVIESQDDLANTINAVGQTMTILLGSVAGISLLVGGIGIMNIMLVSVTERTREIGIRKAVGARRSDIMMQFLTEALTVTLLGGLLGVGAGIGGAELLNGRNISGLGDNIQTVISWSSVIIAFAVSACIGLFFGLYPAQRAASLRPIEALRYE